MATPYDLFRRARPATQQPVAGQTPGYVPGGDMVLNAPAVEGGGEGVLDLPQGGVGDGPMGSELAPPVDPTNPTPLPGEIPIPFTPPTDPNPRAPQGLEPPAGGVQTPGIVPPLSTGGPASDPAAGVGSPDIQTAFHDALLKALTASTNVNDIGSSPAAAARRIASQRGLERLRATNAEAAAQSGTLGGLEGINRGDAFAAAEGQAGFEGDLAQRLEEQRLGLLGGVLPLVQGGTQANNQLGFDYTALQAQQNIQALLALLQSGGVA